MYRVRRQFSVARQWKCENTSTHVLTIIDPRRSPCTLFVIICACTLQNVCKNSTIYSNIVNIYSRWIKHKHLAVNNNISKPDTIKCLYGKGRVRCHIFDDTKNILTRRTTKRKQKQPLLQYSKTFVWICHFYHVA